MIGLLDSLLLLLMVACSTKEYKKPVELANKEEPLQNIPWTVKLNTHITWQKIILTWPKQQWINLHGANLSNNNKGKLFEARSKIPWLKKIIWVIGVKTWVWRWLPHWLSKLQSPWTTVLLRKELLTFRPHKKNSTHQMKGVSSLIGLHLYITDASLKTKNKQTNSGKKRNLCYHCRDLKWQ